VAYPYEPQASGAVCVDDVASLRYNRVFDADTLAVARDWSSAEAMRRDLAHGDDLYEWGVVVRYNDEGVPGAGSCIFLHVWRSEDSPTAGCTAMAKGELLEVLAWLEWAGSGGPVLVQGTRSYLESLRREGVLPYPPPG
jgi:L,D-peptidoglycan transpeptidase YkuD (ErfK/YbiS/YcfS/YnhG family)